ncbi:hypothetical protein AB0D42_27995 [Streptomyces sp. NPDC048304]|uniref:hypothetical protein n=1 Tax=Streptomyces sp. NPDC048304 TaxID=3154820 RepID=UPI00340720F9
MLHVMPLGDAVEHVSDDDCVCGPTAKMIKAEDGSVVWLMIHHSLDGREITEGHQGES